MAEHPALLPYTLSLADDALVLGHRLSQWSSLGPTLEEDIALSNLALDLIGQARLFYTLAGSIEGKGRTEDDLAFFRTAQEFRNILLVELPNVDFADTMVRQLLYAAMLQPYFEAMSAISEPRLAEIAAKAVKEMRYHLRHASEWVIRLGDGTDESHRRTTAALDRLWPFTDELFEMDDGERQLVTVALAPSRAALRPRWEATIAHVLSEAGLEAPQGRTMLSGGRSGHHTEHLASMLADMQSLARAHPGATW